MAGQKIIREASLPWGAWYQDTRKVFPFRSGWDVVVTPFPSNPELSDHEVREAVRTPVAGPPLTELARGKRQIVIAIEDLTRPLPASRIIPLLLEDLEKAGVARESISVLGAVGNHRPMTALDFERKIGMVARSLRTVSHNPFHDVVEVGATSRGTPVVVNRLWHTADLRLAVGTILPHGYVGFSGGPKIVAAGLGGLATLAVNHDRAENGAADGAGNPPGETSADMKEIVQLAGEVHFLVNGLVNDERQITHLFCGEAARVHALGILQAQKVYATPTVERRPIAICNAYPKDMDLIQSENAVNPLGRNLDKVVDRDGIVVIMTPAPEGVGIHYLQGPRMPGETVLDQSRWNGRRLLLYTPTMSGFDARTRFPGATWICSDWRDVIDVLQDHAPGRSANLFPCGAMQLPVP